MSSTPLAPRPRRTLPLRRRVLVAIVSATVLGVVLFAIPLALTVQQLYKGEHVAQLQRDATRVAATAPETVAAIPKTIQRPTGMSSRVQIGLYRTDGQLISGTGPAFSAVAAAARDNRLHEATEGGRLAVSAPVPGDHGVNVTARVSIRTGDTNDGVLLVWLAIAATAAVAVLVAVFLARRQARGIALPLERLTAATTALGDGELPGALPPSGIVEADAAADALQKTAARLDATMRRQRAFSRDVSHQLRTPVTALMLGLESALARPGADLHTSIETAIDRLGQLQHIVEELLVLTEPEIVAGILDFDALADAVRERWNGAYLEQGRSLDVTVEASLPEVRAPKTAVQQILDVLVANALRHGAGAVTVAMWRLGNGVAVDVRDEGPGFHTDADGSPLENSRGHGLPLARALTQLAGGSLVVENAIREPVVRLLLPATRPAQAIAAQGAGGVPTS
jgi:signal transduction histidine kinase